MKWEARKIEKEKWGVFLKEEFSKSGDAVCYGTSVGSSAEKLAKVSAKNLTSNYSEVFNKSCDKKASNSE
jgi:hypothetical protein